MWTKWFCSNNCTTNLKLWKSQSKVPPVIQPIVASKVAHIPAAYLEPLASFDLNIAPTNNQLNKT